MTVAIVTDTTACLPTALVEQYGITVVPLHINFGGRTFVDALDADTAAFYELLRTAPGRPTTSAPSPGMFIDAFTRAAASADAVLCITVSKQFSAMYDSARVAIEQARPILPGCDIRLLDSRNAAMAQGFVVLEAARAAATGASIDGTVARGEAIASRVTLLAMLDTLSHLARGGRVPRVAAWAAGMLQVKPIVRFSASDIKLVARTRTRDRALGRIVDLLAEIAGNRRVHLAVHHANAPADAERLRAAAEARIDCAETYVTEFTQVMGVHTGPGLVGLALWCEDT